MHENSVGLSSTINPKPKGQPSISLPAQVNLTQQKAEPLRCLALRTRGGRLKSSFVPWELSLPTMYGIIQYLVLQIQSCFVDHPERRVNTHLKIPQVFTVDAQLLYNEMNIALCCI